MNKTFQLLLATASLSLAVGCTSKKDPAGATYSFLHPLPIAEGAKLTSTEVALRKSIDSKQPVSYSELTKAFEAMHINSYEERTGNKFDLTTLDGALKSLEKSVVNPRDVFDMKVQYEAEISQQMSPETLDYWVEAVSLPDILIEGALQCYSGTSLYSSVARRENSEDAFIKSHPIIIFEAGHILPGYMQTTPEGWHMYGVETTVGGRGRVDFGLAKKLVDPLRVIDANDWMVVEVFKRHLDTKEMGAMVSSVLSAAAKKYEIPMNPMETRIADGKGQAVTSSKSDSAGTVLLSGARWNKPVINSSPFSFGQADVSSARMKRATVDELPSRNPDHNTRGLTEEFGPEASSIEPPQSGEFTIVPGTSKEVAEFYSQALKDVLAGREISKEALSKFMNNAGILNEFNEACSLTILNFVEVYTVHTYDLFKDGYDKNSLEYRNLLSIEEVARTVQGLPATEKVRQRLEDMINHQEKDLGREQFRDMPLVWIYSYNFAGTF